MRLLGLFFETVFGGCVVALVLYEELLTEPIRVSVNDGFDAVM